MKQEDEKIEEDEFEQLVADSLAEELEPKAPDREAHPSLEAMYEALSGELPDKARAKLSSHLETCEKCRSRWEKLSGVTERELEALEEAADLPSFAELSEEKKGESVSLLENLWDQLSTLIPDWEFRPAVLVPATAGLTAAITLAIALPLLLGSGPNTTRINELTNQVEKLNKQVENLASVSAYSTLPNDATFGPEVEKDTLSSLLDRLDNVSDSSQKALILASFLNSHGLTVPDRFDWSKITPYEITTERTWKEVSEATLGRASFWPLLYILNKGEKELKAGETILVPSIEKDK
ncbi:zf-HC2 domain-containing protein [Candidatus Bipolaricaulota bacterium]|nr:zf-HC2 domain-containing protein [Candidatus Bipolaricaulota bacterium]